MSLPHAQGGLRTAAVFALCGLFAILAMGLTLLASSVYRNTVFDADRNFTHRTALSYLVNQVRRGDSAQGVSVEQFGGGDALRLTEHLDDGSAYVTLLYCFDGQLRELYMEEGGGLMPEDGLAILPLETLALEAEDGLLRISVTDESGETFSTDVSPRTGVGEAAA